MKKFLLKNKVYCYLTALLGTLLFFGSGCLVAMSVTGPPALMTGGIILFGIGMLLVLTVIDTLVARCLEWKRRYNEVANNPMRTIQGEPFEDLDGNDRTDDHLTRMGIQ